MTGGFEDLLHQLGKVFQVTLHVDKSHACSISFHNNLVVQLQLDLALENLWLFCKLIEVPPGRFREEVFREALKANGLPDPRTGVLGYLNTTNHLALFQKYPMEILTGDRLAGLLGAFLEMADSWQKAIFNGRPAPVVSGGSLPNPFGMK